MLSSRLNSYSSMSVQCSEVEPYQSPGHNTSTFKKTVECYLAEVVRRLMELCEQLKQGLESRRL